MSEEYKMVIVVRRDLKMRRGKEWAQVGHAVQALSAEVSLTYVRSDAAWGWAMSGYKKVGLYCASEADLLKIQALAKDLDIPHCLVTDTGRTEFNGVPTNTVIGLGPWKSAEIDKITGPNGEVKCRLA